jgi:inorganic pyrophosphatase/exopolyphosphatase
MILYTEEILDKVYKLYQLKQAKNNLGFMQREDFRTLFEEQQQAIFDQIDKEAELI